MAGTPPRKKRASSRRSKRGRRKPTNRAKQPPKPTAEPPSDADVDAVQDLIAEERRGGDRRREERRQGDRRQGDRREQVRETVSAWEALRAEQDEADEAERKRGRLFRRRD
jgi:hypothetical protein